MKTENPAAPHRHTASHTAVTRLWQRALLTLLRSATGAVQRLPRSTALRFGGWLGRVAYHLARRQRRFADRNLRIARPQLTTRAQRNALTRAVFAHFGRSTIDFLRGPLFTPAELARRVVEIEGWEQVEQALARGQGVIFLTGHLGNWELLGRWLAAKGVHLTAVAREPANPALGDYLRGLRESAGFSVLSKGDSARDLLRALRGGGAVILLADQNSGDLFVPFFGIPAGTVAGPAALALRTGAALIPAYCVSAASDSYRICFQPPLAPPHTGDRDSDIRALTVEVSRALEQIVDRFPEQWLWLHDRWKSAFEEKNRPAWTPEFDFVTARARWMGKKSVAKSESKA